MRFDFIHAEKAQFSVSVLCRLLNVSRQGYYAYVSRPPAERVTRDAALGERLCALQVENRGTYGSRRMLETLRREGMNVGKTRVERTMRGLGLNVVPSKHHVATTQQDERHPKAPNLLDRDFSATKPDQRWVADITYVWTATGWVYVAAILDLFSRAVVGWSIDVTLTRTLPLRALHMALGRRCPSAGLLQHTDRGSQYTSREYREELERHGIIVSMSRTANCWDNAVAESFFATLKKELIHRRTWQDLAEVRAAAFDYIEVFYNRRRLHSTLAYRTPLEVETEYASIAA